MDDFAREMRSLLRGNERYAAGIDRGIMPEGYLEAPLAYDAIWALALGTYVVHAFVNSALLYVTSSKQP